MATRTDASASRTETSATETVDFRGLDGAMAAERGVTVRCTDAAWRRTNLVATRSRAVPTQVRPWAARTDRSSREMAGGSSNRGNGEWNALARGADGGYGGTSGRDGLSNNCNCVTDECDGASAVLKRDADRFDGDATHGMAARAAAMAAWDGAMATQAGERAL